jgi:hypothetical protein
MRPGLPKDSYAMENKVGLWPAIVPQDRAAATLHVVILVCSPSLKCMLE